MILDLFIKSLKFWFILFMNHHSDFFHWVIETFPIIPVDPFGIICVSILSIKICPLTCVIPPPSVPSCSTVTSFIIIVIVVRSKKHSVMVLHTVFWKKWSFTCEISLIVCKLLYWFNETVIIRLLCKRWKLRPNSRITVITFIILTTSLKYTFSLRKKSSNY